MGLDCDYCVSIHKKLYIISLPRSVDMLCVVESMPRYSAFIFKPHVDILFYIGGGSRKTYVKTMIVQG